MGDLFFGEVSMEVEPTGVCVCAPSLQSCLTLCNPVDCRLPGSSVLGILQARILEWLPFPSPGGLPNPGIEPRSPTLEADTLTSEPPGKPNYRGIVIIHNSIFYLGTIIM